MTEDSQDDSKKPDSQEFEFNASDIPGLNFAEESAQPLDSTPPAESFSFEQPVVDQPLSEESFQPAAMPTGIEDPLATPPAESLETAATAASSDTPSEPVPSDTIQKVREFSEKMPMEKVQVPAAFPFSLLIEGELTPEEKEKLLDVLSRESMGIREVDLEPQFTSHRILIPRISEYAGIILVQALRGTRAKMRLGPSETIFSAQDADLANDPLQPGARLPEPEAPLAPEPVPEHPAERIAITPDSKLPQLVDFDVIDTILATAVLTSNSVEAESSCEYTDALENLMRELKYKAYRKGAVGIIHFKAELQQLSLANQYRLMISGAAVRPRSSSVSADVESINSPSNSPFEASH